MKSIFSIFRSRDKPEEPAIEPLQNASGVPISSAVSFLFGGTPAGRPVTPSTAMQSTAVYACVRILSESVAVLPLHLYRYKQDGDKEKAPQHPLYRVLHDEPNPEMTSFVFRETLMSHLLLYGNAYAQIIRDGRGQVLYLYPLLLPSEKTRLFAKFNVDGLFRGDYASRMSGYSTARQNGWISANDIRGLENMNRISTEEGGDLYLVNGNMTKLADAGAFSETIITETGE